MQAWRSKLGLTSKSAPTSILTHLSANMADTSTPREVLWNFRKGEHLLRSWH